MEIYNEIEAANKRIRSHILHTPLIRSRWLGSLADGEVYLKLENEQYTGSFKARGSLNKLMWLQERGQPFYPVTASTGNHGLGFARSLELLGLEGRVYLPETAVNAKVEKIAAYGADIEYYGDDPYKTEMHAKKLAEKQDQWTYISPYNDRQVIGGQGTIGIEIFEDIQGIDNLLATVGGGGLISGVASYFARHLPGTQIIGCQPENSPEMAVSVRAGRYQEVTSSPTLSDGSAGGFERDSMTFALCRQLVDQFILVSEQEIEDAIRMMIEKHGKLVEGAAAVAVAGFLKKIELFRGKTTVIIICGGNISRDQLKTIL
ncbi:threonine/serine dehydratase [Halalkalibaculum sp. DA3122]|uniref:threonine/serine dehydratase n=1 Tax=unclassified Halalkalibaculum TaxID=2964617 RepID=UPI003754DACC